MKYLIVLSLSLYSFYALATGYQISVKVDEAAGKKIKLAYYYLGNIYLKDSVMFDNAGSGVFKGDTLLPQGLYMIYLDEKNNFDFLLGADQDFSVSRKSFISTDLEIKGAVESEEFLKYTRFLKELQNKGTELNKRIGTAPAADKPALKKELEGLTSKVHEYWLEIYQKYPKTMLAAFLTANYVPALDVSSLPVEVQKNDSILLLAKFYYQQKHFWDYFDYTDERMLYTPLFKPKLETWFTKVLFQDYDSVKTEVIDFIEKVKPHKRIFQFAASWFLNSSINSNVMGMDAMFVDIARRYYLSGQAFWTTDESLKKIRENVMFLEHNLIGMTAPDLTLETFDGEFVNLHKIKSKITIVLIYEPTCSHCKEFVPKFHADIYEKYKSRGLSVYAIYSMNKKEEWGEFLQKHNMFDWINVWDERHISQFKILYDARKTPGVYVLDENKKIIAKGMQLENFDRFLAGYLN